MWLVFAVLIFAVAVIFLATIFGLFVTMPFLTYFLPEPNILAYLGASAIFLTIAIPLIALLVYVAGKLQKRPFRFSSLHGLHWVWLVALFFSIYTAANTVYDFNSKASYTTEISIAPTTEILNVQMQKMPEGNFKMEIFDYVRVRGGLEGEYVYLNVKYTDEPNVRLEKKVSAHGASYEKAMDNAAYIEIDEVTMVDNVLTLPSTFKIPKGKRIRAQEVEYILYLPEGQEVNFDKSLYDHLDVYHIKSKDLNRSSFDEYTWRMETSGLYSGKIDLENNHTRNLDLDKINELYIEGSYDVTIRKGDTYNIQLKGPKDMVENIDVIDLGGIVNINTKSESNKRVEINITLPELKSLNADGLQSLYIAGLNQDSMEVICKGNEDLKIFCTVSNLELTLSGRGSAELIGSGQTLNLHLLDNTSVNAEKYKVQTVNAKSESRKNSSVYASDNFNVEEDKRHTFEVYGNPAIELYR